MSRRLVYVVNDAGYFLSHRLALAQAAKAAGWDVHVATAPGPAQPSITAAGFVGHTVPLNRSGLRPDREALSVIALARLFRRLAPDLVHLVALKAVVLGGLAARLAGVPAMVFTVAGLGHVFSARGAKPALARLVVRAMLVFVVTARARLIVQNPDDRRLLARNRRLADRIVLIPGSGVDLDRFRPAPESAGLPAVLMASRLLWTKGVGEFVAAAEDLAAKGVAARFRLAGDTDPGNPAAVPRAQLAEWSARGSIEYLGLRDDMPELLAASHVVCLPSFYGEGVPKILIEAAACGRPIVTTDMPGCRDVVRDGENGLLVPPRDAALLARAIERLVNDSGLRHRLGERGRAIAEAGYGLDRINRATLAVYAELCPPAFRSRAEGR